MDSSGHCEVSKEQGYKKATYQQFPESLGAEILSTSRSSENELSRQVIGAETVKSVTGSTPLSSKFNPKLRLSARLQNRIANDRNGFFLPRIPFLSKRQVSYPEHQSMTEHGRAARVEIKLLVNKNTNS